MTTIKIYMEAINGDNEGHNDNNSNDRNSKMVVLLLQ